MIILTKKDLVEALSKYPDDAVVSISDADTGWDMNIDTIVKEEREQKTLLSFIPSGYNADFRME